MSNERNRTIIKTSAIGIAANLVLVGFKMTVGLIANSIAIILDAVNNLSDALSSLITIIGAKLSGKAPDKKHPYGHGRIEYIASMIVAFIVLAAGVAAIRESILKIITPQKADYDYLSVIIMSVAVVVKIVMGLYMRKVGKRIDAQALVASGTDAFFDAVLSVGTLIAIAVSMIWHISIEGIIGLVISAIIIKAGVDILIEVFNTIIGTRADEDLVRRLKETINSFDGVNGTYDLTLHNYGPARIIGSAHVEVRDDMTAREIHDLTRRIVLAVATKHGVLMTIGIYAANDSTEKFAEMKRTAEEAVAAHKEILQMHGFYVNEELKIVMFDVIVDFGANAEAIRSDLVARMTEKYPEYRTDVVLDTDFSD